MTDMTIHICSYYEVVHYLHKMGMLDLVLGVISPIVSMITAKDNSTVIPVEDWFNTYLGYLQCVLR